MRRGNRRVEERYDENEAEQEEMARWKETERMRRGKGREGTC